MDSNNSIKYLFFIPAVLFISSLYIAGSSIYQYQTTGLVEVSTSDAEANIYVTGDQLNAAFVGQGTASVRLKEGSYVFIAAIGDNKSIAQVEVVSKEVSTVKLAYTQNYSLPTVEAINFNGIDELIDRGLTNSQSEVLKRYLFYYDKQSRNININTSSVKEEPRDRYSASTSIGTNFSLTIDGTYYTANIQRSLLDDSLQLKLYNEQGGLVFDSTTISSKNDG